MGISDIENSVEQLEEDSIVLAEKKERNTIKEQALKDSLAKLRNDVKLFGIVNEYHNEVQQENSEIDEQIAECSIQVERIENDLNQLITENEHSRSIILELESIGEDVTESLNTLEKRQVLIDECTERLQEIKARLGLDDFQALTGGQTAPYEEAAEQELQKTESAEYLPIFEKPDFDSASVSYRYTVELMDKYKIRYNKLRPYGRVRSTEEIVKDLSGGDMTKGSCSSLAFAYAGNKAGFDVLDFRGGDSRTYFAIDDSIERIAHFTGVDSSVVWDKDDFHAVEVLQQKMKPGKEYYLAAGRHAAIVRKCADKYEYLELQSPDSWENVWHKLDNYALQVRFACEYVKPIPCRNILMDVDTLAGSQEFLDILGYCNTAENEQQKGAQGHVK